MNNYPLNHAAHNPDNCAACTVLRKRTQVTDRDNDSLAYFLSDPTAGHLFLTI